MIRVLIVDDSAFVRQALQRMLREDPEIEVVGTARDGQEAIERVTELRPDVVTLDLQMPRMGGLEALERIMATHPVPVLLLSSQARQGADVTLRALEMGALDFIDKSGVGNMSILTLSDELREKIHALARVAPERLAPRASTAGTPPVGERQRAAAELVVIATSTGGPKALQAVIPSLPASLGAAVLVVQHMPPGFTQPLAERLAQRSALPVREAQDGEALAPGQVLIAPAGLHMKLRKRADRVRVWLDEEPRSALHRPSADVLMACVAKLYGPQALGVILTGMGSDGVLGLRALRAAGGRSLAESEETCVIYGMPKAAVEAGVVDRSLPLWRMADAIRAAVYNP
jgi:two-component system chemotaxis response regulator CheB